MPKPIPRLLLASLLVLLSLVHGPTRAAEAVLYQSDNRFEDVLDALKLGIEERGLYINNVMNMGEMLARTGKDLGAAEVLFTRAESVEFCSAVLSRQMAAEDPARIIHCPFIISAYTLPDRPGITFVAHRAIPESELAESPAMRAVAAMLKELAEAAVNW